MVVVTSNYVLSENSKEYYVLCVCDTGSLIRASVSLSYVTIAFNVARPFCLMDVAEF